MSNRSGGPAFPHHRIWTDGVIESPHPQEGMSLRDFFAAKAMNGYLSKAQAKGTTPEQIAEGAYCIADAMINERER